MNSTVSQVLEEARKSLEAVKTAEELESFRIAFLGKKGKITVLFEALKGLNGEEKRAYGRDVNHLRSEVLKAMESKSGALGPVPQHPAFDETLPGIRPVVGRLHPIIQTIQEVSRILERLGFEMVDGPEIETEFHNFTALNIPLDHASREAFDTFYTESRHLLRSQTSTVQIRVMQNRKPPLRIAAPGRVYRPDTVDASHSFMFHQIEGLLVAKSVPFSDLKGVIHLILRELFGSDVKLRFRPHFFPFTEPSVEVDIQWGKGWLEILGAGSVDPNVFKAVGYDPGTVQGLAFGLGVERITMLRHGISDIRHFYENDLRFLRQFS